MKIELNGKKIEGTLPKAIVLIGSAAVVVLLATILIPFLGVVLGLAVFALAIAIPLFGWKMIVGKITEKINFFPDELGNFCACHSELYESMSTNKRLVLKCKHGDIIVSGTDDYNKFTIKAKGLFYNEGRDEIQLRSCGAMEVICPASQRLSVFSGTGDIKISQIREIDIASGSGNIEIIGLKKYVKAAAGAGDFTISFSPDATEGKVELATASGDAVIHLPADVSVDYAAKSLSGDVRSERPSTAGAPFKVSFTAASGNLTLV